MHSYHIVADCVDRHAHSRRNAARTALICIDALENVRTFSFSELKNATIQSASRLRRVGLKSGQRVILQLANGPDFPIVFLGAMRLDAVPIPVSTLLTSKEVAFLKKDSGARFVLRDADWARIKNQKMEMETRLFRMRPGKAAYWLYTSGTEGRPKAVMHAHASIPAHDSRSRLWLDLHPTDVAFNTSAMNWSYALTAGLLDVWRPGATAVIAEGPMTAERMARIVKRFQVNVFMSVPGLYRRLAEFGKNHSRLLREAFRGVKSCLSAGEKLPFQVRSDFRRMTGRMIREGLGMTEHSVYLIQRKGARIVEGSCGCPVPGNRVEILHEDATPARPREIGILSSHRSCPGLMTGYYRRPREEQASYCKGWFLSGDLAYRDEKGNFFYVGRRDDVITAGGYRISPMEVEAVVGRHRAISECAARGWEVSPGKTTVAIFVVLKKGFRKGERLEADILRFAGRQLARYKAPRKVLFLDSIPKTANGKVRRSAL